MSHLARMLGRGKTTGTEAGQGVVAQLVGPGEIRLVGRAERVLVAGDAVPAVGQRVTWLRADRNTLVVSQQTMRPRHTTPPPSSGRAWQEVEVNYDRSNAGVLFTHRDSTGRYWLKSYRTAPVWYSQEAADFLVTPWTARLTSSCEPAGRSSHVGVGDLVLEVGTFGLYALAVQSLDIDAESGTMSAGAFAVLPDRPPDGWPFNSDVCRDSAGRYHVASAWDYPYLVTPQRWREWCWMSAADDPTSWSNTLAGEYGQDASWFGRPRLFAVGDAVVKFGHTVDPAGTNQHVYRVCWDGSWGDEQETPFDGNAVWGESVGDTLYLVHAPPAESGGGLECYTARLDGGSLVFSAATRVADTPYVVTAPGTQRNYEGDMPPAALWVSWRTATDSYEFRRFGLPLGDSAEEIATPVAGHEPSGEWSLAGGDTSGGRDGFVGYYRSNRLYAARIVEA